MLVYSLSEEFDYQVRMLSFVKVIDQVNDKVWYSVRSHLLNRVRDQVWYQVWDRVMDQVWEQVGEQL